MEDREFAAELVLRLNCLCDSDFTEVKDLVEKMIETRHEVSDVMENHPTIVPEDDGVGLLELLNGLAGFHPAGEHWNLGYISVMDKGPEFPGTFHKFVIAKEELQSTEICAPCWKECKCGKMFMDLSAKNTRRKSDGCQG